MKLWQILIVSVVISVVSAFLISYLVPGIPEWFYFPWGIFVGMVCGHINNKVTEWKELEKERKLAEQHSKILDEILEDYYNERLCEDV